MGGGLDGLLRAGALFGEGANHIGDDFARPFDP
jgi:hypothetical protein